MIGKSFSHKTFQALCEGGDIKKVKAYVKNYFFKSDGDLIGVFFYDALTRQFKLMKNEDIKRSFLFRKCEGKSVHFSVNDWFFKEDTDYYRPTFEPLKPRMFKKDGVEYINYFTGFIHKSKQFNTYDDETTEKVDFILKYILECLCSNNDTMFMYLLSCLAKIITGHKLETLLYFKGSQGAGKSTLTEYLQNKILGDNLVKVSNSSEVIDSFNSELVGKLILVLEELPTDSTNQWKSLSNSIKRIITNKTIDLKQKYKDTYEMKNYVSVIINTNNNALCITYEDRRPAVFDISNKRIGDFKYWTKLYQYMDDDTVAEAFYNYMVELYDPEFNERIIPETEAKKELIIETLPRIYKYIRDYHIKQKKDIQEQPLQMFYTDYYKIYPYGSIIEISKLLKSIGVVTEVKNIGGSNKRCISATYKSLLEKFNKNGWLHETDDIEGLTTTTKTEPTPSKGIKNVIYKEFHKVLNEYDEKFDDIQVDDSEIDRVVEQAKKDFDEGKVKKEKKPKTYFDDDE